MSPRVVVSLSRFAMAALVVAMLGVAFALYGHIQEVSWASQVGTIMLFGGAILYIIERLRSSRQTYQSSDDEQT